MHLQRKSDSESLYLTMYEFSLITYELCLPKGIATRHDHRMKNVAIDGGLVFVVSVGSIMNVMYGCKLGLGLG